MDSTFKLDDKHFFLQCNKEVEKAIDPFLKKFDLSYFQYGRVYRDGSQLVLLNRCDFLKTYYQKQYPTQTYIDEKLSKKQSYFFFWNEHLRIDTLRLARNDFGMDHGICFIERYKDYYNLVAFASSPSKSSPYEFYLNHIDDLRYQILSFKEKAKDLIEKAYANRIFFPDVMRDACEEEQFSLHNVENQFSYNRLEAPMTVRELDCLFYLNEGFSAKEIAGFLAISPRSVETYFIRIKNKFGLNFKSELLSLAKANGIRSKYSPQ